MSPFSEAFPAGHFYSALPDAERIELEYDRYRRLALESTAGLDLREGGQLALLEVLRPFIDECPFPESQTGGFRFYFENEYFSYGDAAICYAMLRHLAPQRIVEVGSGFSTALIFDTMTRHFAGGWEITAIDPVAERVMGLFPNDESSLEILKVRVEDAPMEVFSRLKADDLLFIDSSHVVKFGSEVPYLISGILPRLAAGVVVHIHDIFWPFEYPREWLAMGLAFNEAYLVRAFLQYNEAFEITFFNQWAAHTHPEKLPALCRRNPGGSLWLRKVK